MQRRNFLQLLAALPLVGWMVPKPYSLYASRAGSPTDWDFKSPLTNDQKLHELANALYVKLQRQALVKKEYLQLVEGESAMDGNSELSPRGSMSV